MNREIRSRGQLNRTHHNEQIRAAAGPINLHKITQRMGRGRMVSGEPLRILPRYIHYLLTTTSRRRRRRKTDLLFSSFAILICYELNYEAFFTFPPSTLRKSAN